MEHNRTEEALRLAVKEHDLWMYQNEKEEAKRLHGARKLRKDGEMAWAPPRNIVNWLDCEEATSMEESGWEGWNLKGKRRCQTSLFVSDAVEGTFVDLDGESRHEQVEAKLFEKRKRNAQ